MQALFPRLEIREFGVLELLRSVALIVFLLLSFSQSVLAKSVALVIGNSAYEHVPRLANPTADAASVAESLKAAGFDVVEFRKDLTATDMRHVLRDYADTVRGADVAVIYYAGHGLEIDGTNYLVPVDAVLARDIDAFDEAIPLNRLLTVTESAKKFRLIILDACRDNPFATAMKRTIGSRAIRRGLAEVEPDSPNTLIAYAAKAGSTASDGDGSHSPFTGALVRYITKPGLDIRKALGFVRDDVLRNTDNRQEPFVYGSLGGEDVSLVPGRTLTLTPRSEEPDDTRRDYEFALQVGTTAAWNSFLSSHPQGFYSDLAREQLRKAIASSRQNPTDSEQKPEFKPSEHQQSRVDRSKKLQVTTELPRPKPEAAGQIICNQGGCRPVRKGCHIERASKTWVYNDVEICP